MKVRPFGIALMVLLLVLASANFAAAFIFRQWGQIVVGFSNLANAAAVYIAFRQAEAVRRSLDQYEVLDRFWHSLRAGNYHAHLNVKEMLNCQLCRAISKTKGELYELEGK